MKREGNKGNLKIPILPMIGIILIDPIKVNCIYEKEAKKKDPKIILDKNQIRTWNKQKIESSGEVTGVWDEHPDQGVIVSLTDEDAESHDLKIGDKIAFNHTDYAIIFVFDGKKYLGLRPGEIIGRYLTSGV